MKFVASLRDALNIGRRRIARTPFAIAMSEGTISSDEYASALVQLRAIHDSLETAFDRNHDSLGRLDHSMRRTAALDRDLQHWDFAVDELAQLPATVEIVRQIDGWSLEAPWRLLGALYVLEDWRMSSRSLIGTLAAGLGVAPELGAGLDYHAENSEVQPLNWRLFKESLEAAPLSAEARDEICDAARSTMEQLVLLYKSLPLAQAAAVGQAPA
jgi:heme oxygenase